jgi:hypothetical protein
VAGAAAVAIGRGPGRVASDVHGRRPMLAPRGFSVAPQPPGSTQRS